MLLDYKRENATYKIDSLLHHAINNAVISVSSLIAMVSRLSPYHETMALVDTVMGRLDRLQSDLLTLWSHCSRSHLSSRAI